MKVTIEVDSKDMYEVLNFANARMHEVGYGCRGAVERLYTAVDEAVDEEDS